MKFHHPYLLSFLALSLCQCDTSKTKKSEGSITESIDDDQTTNPTARLNTSELSFPYQTTLTNQDGRSIEVTIVGRSKGSVTFTKAGSDKPIEYPIPHLSMESAQLVKRFPVKSYRPAQEPSHYQNKRVAFLEKRIVELESDLSRYERGSLKYKSIQKKIRATEAEIEAVR